MKQPPESVSSVKRQQSRSRFTTVCIAQPPPTEIIQVNQPQLPSILANLERRFQDLERGKKDAVSQASLHRDLEYLVISQDGTGRYWITIKGTGEPFIRKPFAQSEYCIEAVLELEEAFDILRVIELRPPETIKRIEEMAEFYLEREKVLLAWG